MAELTVPQIDFSSLGQLPQIYKQGQADQLRQQTLASLGRGGPADAAALIRSGDQSLASLGIQLQNTEYQHGRDSKNDTRQAAQDALTAQHWNQSYDLQKRAAARADEDKFSVQKVENPDGTTSFVRIKTTGGEGVIPTTLPTAAASGNPFSPGGKFNGDQGKAAGFTDRMLQSEGVLSGVAPATGIGPPVPGVQDQGNSVTQTGLSKIPGVGNFVISGDRQKYNQAKSDFINAQLRRESGAAIAQSEFDNADKQYFPVPGDKPEVIKQKAANRRAAVEAMGREGGGSYRPKFNFGEDGAVTPYGQPVAPPAAASVAAAPAVPTAPPPPKVGQMQDGWRYRGGNPADPASWAKAQ